MNWWRKLRMKIRLQQLSADEDIMKVVKEGIKKIEKVETKECTHQILNQLMKGDLWYQCKECKMVFFFQGGAGWDINQIPILTKNLNESLNIKEESEQNKESKNAEEKKIQSNKKKNK